MSTLLHKQKNKFSILKSDNKIIDEEEQNIRRSETLKLFSKGYTQTEIAQKLKVNQSTISRDLQEIKNDSRKYIENIVCNEIPFEFKRTLTGLDEIIKSSWKIIEDYDNVSNIQKISAKEKHDILNLLESLYVKRLQLIIGGNPKDSGESSLNLDNSLRGMKFKGYVWKSVDFVTSVYRVIISPTYLLSSLYHLIIWMYFI